VNKAMPILQIKSSSKFVFFPIFLCLAFFYENRVKIIFRKIYRYLVLGILLEIVQTSYLNLLSYT
jgi:hypothetical protein